jgi:RNA polymerase sigma-70 factor (ECF subfamily)
VSDESRRRFEEEIVPHTRALYNTALRLVRNEADARDLVQETFLRAYRTFSGYTPGTNGRAWVFTILYSVFINRYRRAQRDPDLLSMDELEERFHLELSKPANGNAIPPGTAARVEQALAALPDVFRAAVILVDLEDMSYEDAAGVAGCPVGTLRSRLFRGRRLLASSLGAYAPRGPESGGGSQS